jgi:hypothetical protein
VRTEISYPNGSRISRTAVLSQKGISRNRRVGPEMPTFLLKGSAHAEERHCVFGSLFWVEDITVSIKNYVLWPLEDRGAGDSPTIPVRSISVPDLGHI